MVTVQFDLTSNVWVAPANDLNHGKQITTGKLDGDRGVTWTPDGRIVFSSIGRRMESPLTSVIRAPAP